jgi:glutamyl-tRNA reductase
MESVTLINLDELSQMTNATLVKRKKIVPVAEQILNEVSTDFLRWIEHRKFAPTLKALKNKLLDGQTQDLPVQDDFSQTVNRLTGRVASYLKKNPSKADEILSMLQDLYQLDSEIDA